MTLLDVYVCSCPPPLPSLCLFQDLVSDALTCFSTGLQLGL